MTGPGDDEEMVDGTLPGDRDDIGGSGGRAGASTEGRLKPSARS